MTVKLRAVFWQSLRHHMEWMSRINDKIKVDVLLVHCWMLELEKSVECIKPELIITGHENEMGHAIDHREAYWLTFRRFANIEVPYIVMAWGETFIFSRQGTVFCALKSTQTD